MMPYWICLLSVFTSFSAYSLTWHDLWFTQDQQGQQLMEKKQFKEAQEKFTHNEWAAAAAYRAGNYQRAAELYQHLHTEQGYYNQGNALAHLGQYEQAIKAYDSALAINSTNQDALHNRQLVESLLKQNKEQQSKEQQSKEQQSKEQQSKEQQSKEQQSKEQQSKEQQSKEQQNKEQQNKEQQNKEQQNKEQQNKEQQNKEQQNKEQQNKEQQNKEQQNKAAQSEADREKKQAQEQWLRLIPDDPGGLMREKFLRDHLRRQNGWEQ